MQNKFEKLSALYPDTVILQLRGKFYNAFGDSAYILSSVMDYKLKDEGKTPKCGFPVESLDKVKDVFEKIRINLLICDSENEEFINYDDNKYNNYLDYRDILEEEKQVQRTQHFTICGENPSLAMQGLSQELNVLIRSGHNICSVTSIWENSEQVGNESGTLHAVAIYEKR